MPLIYVSGVSGTGKSTVLPELQRVGEVAYGVDEDGLGDWINEAGVADDIELASKSRNFEIHDWIANHRWVFNKSRLIAIKDENPDSRIYICGSAMDEDNCIAVFDEVYALHVEDFYVLAGRIANRTDTDFGKATEELESIRRWHGNAKAFYAEMGAVMIDATQPVGAIVQKLQN